MPALHLSISLPRSLSLSLVLKPDDKESAGWSEGAGEGGLGSFVRLNVRVPACVFGAEPPLFV